MARIFMSDDLIIVRTGICEGFSGDLSLIPYISHQLLQGDANEAEQLQVELYVEHGTEIPSALAHYQAHTISLHKLIQLATPHPLNLLQGEFEPISPWLLGIKIAMPVIKPIALVCLLLGLSTSLSYAKKYLDTKAIEADILQQLQQQTPEARGQWQDYFKQQLRYYQNAQRDTLPWRSFQNLLPLLQSCKACKITSLTVDQNGVHISLLSNTQQDKFARQSSDALRIESTKDKAGNHSYQLRWDAQ